MEEGRKRVSGAGADGTISYFASVEMCSRSLFSNKLKAVLLQKKCDSRNLIY